MKNTILTDENVNLERENKTFLNIVELLFIKSQTNSAITETDTQRSNDIKKKSKELDTLKLKNEFKCLWQKLILIEKRMRKTLPEK